MSETETNEVKETVEFAGKPTSKTYKREYAFTLTAFWAGMWVYGITHNDQNALTAAKEMTWPVIGFAAGAFGFDAIRKQY